MAYDSTKPATSGSFVAADIRENFRALKEDWIITGQQVQEIHAVDATYITGAGVTPFDDTIPQITEGDEILTAVITPKSATNILTIRTDITLSANDVPVIAHLHRDAVANALVARAQVVLLNHLQSAPLFYRMVAGGTSEITFRLRVGASSSVYYINGRYSAPAGRILGGVSRTSIQIIESQAS